MDCLTAISQGFKFHFITIDLKFKFSPSGNSKVNRFQEQKSDLNIENILVKINDANKAQVNIH